MSLIILNFSSSASILFIKEAEILLYKLIKYFYYLSIKYDILECVSWN